MMGYEPRIAFSKKKINFPIYTNNNDKKQEGLSPVATIAKVIHPLT
jgi:hypothetical protein